MRNRYSEQAGIWDRHACSLRLILVKNPKILKKMNFFLEKVYNSMRKMEQ